MYYTYMLRCSDNSIYTGITTDVQRRFNQHSKYKAGGAKYTQSRIPVKVEQVWQSPSRSDASKLEYRIKSLSKEKKEVLIAEPNMLVKLLSDKIDCCPYQNVDILPQNTYNDKKE